MSLAKRLPIGTGAESGVSVAEGLSERTIPELPVGPPDSVRPRT